jgi:site-specific DNA-methyltransferase (adenine-specific)
MKDYKVLIGDCRDTLKTLPEQSVNTCVTSPPYFGLRDYGHEGQMGVEPTPDEFVAALVEVFREVRRVLRDDGTVWLNLGDSYAANRSYQVSDGKHQSHDFGKSNASRVPQGLKQKDLIGIPWRVAFALQADGWYLRQDIIWHKPNPMPESVTDRCTKSHEYIFMLSKSPKYYYDHEAVKEPAVSTHSSGNGFKRDARESYKNADGSSRGNESQWSDVGGKRNRRSVWTVPTKPYKGAHFATFPPALIEPCILAGCPEGGTVLDPFGGSGTTAGVAVSNGRNAVICELNPEYVELIAERVAAVSGSAMDRIAAEKQIDIFAEAV